MTDVSHITPKTSHRGTCKAAAGAGHTQIVIKLLAAGADLHRKKTNGGDTALSIAAQDLHIGAVEVLLKANGKRHTSKYSDES